MEITGTDYAEQKSLDNVQIGSTPAPSGNPIYTLQLEGVDPALKRRVWDAATGEEIEDIPFAPISIDALTRRINEITSVIEKAEVEKAGLEMLRQDALSLS